MRVDRAIGVKIRKTGKRERGDDRREASMRVDDFVHKPFDLDVLLDKIERHLQEDVSTALQSFTLAG